MSVAGISVVRGLAQAGEVALLKREAGAECWPDGPLWTEVPQTHGGKRYMGIRDESGGAPWPHSRHVLAAEVIQEQLVFSNTAAEAHDFSGMTFEAELSVERATGAEYAIGVGGRR